MQQRYRIYDYRNRKYSPNIIGGYERRPNMRGRHGELIGEQHRCNGLVVERPERFQLNFAKSGCDTNCDRYLFADGKQWHRLRLYSGYCIYYVGYG
jgi:hypothetical protein